MLTILLMNIEPTGYLLSQAVEATRLKLTNSLFWVNQASLHVPMVPNYSRSSTLSTQDAASSKSNMLDP